MKTWHTTYRDNHLRLKRVHIGCTIFYALFLLPMLLALLMQQPINSFFTLLLMVIFCTFPICLHALLAYGAAQKYECSRKVSEMVFAIMLLGFPIGTWLAIYFFLPRTQWQAPDETEAA